MYEAPGYSNQGFHLFLATQLSQGENNLDITEQELRVIRVTVKEFENFVKKGEITDTPSVGAYGLLKISEII